MREMGINEPGATQIDLSEDETMFDVISNSDIEWNQLGYKQDDYAVHIHVVVDGDWVNFWGRFLLDGVLNGQVKYRFEVNHKPSDDKMLMNRVLDYIKSNWTSDQEVRIHILGGDQYRVMIGDESDFIVTVTDIAYDLEKAQLKAFTFRREEYELMVPFGDVIRAMLVELYE